MASRKHLFAATIWAAVLLLTVPGSAMAHSHKRHHKHHSHQVVRSTKKNAAGGSFAGSTMTTSTARGVTLAALTATPPATKCPPDPAPGSTINGGLDVTGICHLTDVIVNGGLVVEANAHVELENSAVNGPTVVRPGGELDSGHGINNDVDTGIPSSFNGGIDWSQGYDLDLVNARVNGAVTLTGPPGPALPTICGTTINGGLSLIGMTSLVYGDPGEPLEAGTPADCPGNTIIGPVTVSNSHGLELEGNQIVGSTTLANSQIDFWGNQVIGSLQCQSGSTLTNIDGDATPNSVLGQNTCP